MAVFRSIAAAQTVPAPADVAANMESHIRLVEAAAEEGARLLVFPELSLTGYELDRADELAFSERDDRLDPLVALAASHAMTLIVGAPVRVDGRLHIGAFIVSPDGPVGLYTKHRLGAFPADANPGGRVPPAEPTVFSAGDKNPLVVFDKSTAAVAVCADTGRPEHVADAADRGASCYLASMFFTPSELEDECARLSGYAARHKLAVALANYGGPSGGLAAAGGSAIWSQRGELLAQLEGGAGIVVAVEEESGWRASSLAF